jgi:hypothetical protein
MDEINPNELFGRQRFMAQIDLGGLLFSRFAQTIDLLAAEVAPVVRHETAQRKNTIKTNKKVKGI